MKPNSNKILIRSFKFFIALPFIVFTGCQIFEKTDIRPPKAEITNIYNVTDSCANVDIQVTQQSNAWSVYFYLVVGLTDNLTDTSHVLIISLNPRPDLPVASLNNSYTTKISKLNSKTKYFLHLHFRGYFDIGGPNEWHEFNVGETKSFITK